MLDTFFTIRNFIIFFMIITLIKNIMFLVINPWYVFKEKLRQTRHPASDNPKVSVIIPAWNEEVGVIKTMQSIIANSYSNKEIIVINDGSTDDTDKVIRNYLQKNPNQAAQIKYISQLNGGKGKALNTGIVNSSGDIIVTCDADSAFDKEALSKLVKYYNDPSIMAVVGNVKIQNSSHTWVGFMQQVEYQFGFYNKRGHAVLGGEYIFGGACASFRRDVFNKLGLFDEKNKTEDIEMSMRVRAAGMKSTYGEDVLCFTEGASEIQSLISQRVRWKKGRLDTFWKYRNMFFSTEDRHSFFLSFMILPFSLLTEFQLLLEPMAIAILVVYSFITGEFISISVGIMFIALIYIIGPLFAGPKKLWLMTLSFPFSWCLFYILDWIEFVALIKSINMYTKKEDIVWQSWNRQGIK